MNPDFVAVTFLIALWWLGLFAVLSGLGLLVRRAFGLPISGVRTWILSFWSGWVCAVLILQFWHLWLKIDGWTFALIVTMGTAGLLWNRSDLWQLVRARPLRNALFSAILLLMALWIANRALGPIQNGDTGLYHMTAVKWAASYPIIPGLGNLHGRLAYNSSFFLYAAMLGVGPWVQKSHYLANGLLLLVLLAQILLSVYKVLFTYSTLRYYHIFNSLLFAPALAQVFHPHISSLTPDIMIFSLGIILTSQIYYYFLNYNKHSTEENYNILYITILCIGGITVKISFIPLGGIALALIFLSWCWQGSNQDNQQMKKVLMWSVLFNASLLTIWIVRSVILSGYMIFPATFGGFPVAWRVPRSLALSEVHWIRSWARAPGIFWPEVLGNWNWLRPWLRNFPYEYTKPLIIGFLAIGLHLIMMVRTLRKPLWGQHLTLAVVVAPFISVIFWFFSAPDPRFSGACFWILGAGFTALTLEKISLKSWRTIKTLDCLIFFAFLLYLFPPYHSLLIWPNKDNGPFYDIPTPEYLTTLIDNTSQLHIPKSTDQCWDIPLPCTPYYRPTLHLRNTTLNSGFILDDTFTFADIHQGSMPSGLMISSDIGSVFMGTTWPGFDERSNIRWMYTPVKLLVYTEQSSYVKISLKPFAMNVHGSLRNEGQLKVTLNNTSNADLTVKTEVITEVVLQLRPDFNVITLELNASYIAGNDRIIGKAETPPLSIAFYFIELTSIGLLG